MVLRFSRGRVGSRLFKVRSKDLTFFIFRHLPPFTQKATCLFLARHRCASRFPRRSWGCCCTVRTTNTDITTPMTSAPPLLMYIFRPVAEDVVHEEGDERTDRGESRHAERRAVSLEAFRPLQIALGAVARGARLHCCFRRTIAACLRWSPSGSFCSCCSCLRRIALCCPRIPCRLRILLSLRPTDPVAAALFMVALLILPAPQLLQTPHPPQPPAPQIPPGGRCSWWSCRFFRRRSSCVHRCPFGARILELLQVPQTLLLPLILPAPPDPLDDADFAASGVPDPVGMPPLGRGGGKMM